MSEPTSFTIEDLDSRTAECSCGKTEPSVTCAKANFVYRGDTIVCIICGFAAHDHDVTRHAVERDSLSQHSPRLDALYDGHDFVPTPVMDTYYCGHAGWD